jgi:hypothetical protein
MPVSEDPPPSVGADSAEALVFKLVEGIISAFDRDPDAPQCPENERTRLAEALNTIARFIQGFPNLGPSYANHFDEIASALKDWNKGANPRLLDRQKGISTPLTSLESRASVDIILAVEALKASGVSLSDRYKSIDISRAISEVLGEFKVLKEWVDKKSGVEVATADTILNWRKELSRKAGRKGIAANDEATELLAAGRDFIKSKNGNIKALRDFARQCAKRAERNALSMGV